MLLLQKKTMIRSIAITIITLLVLSSCSNQMSLVKRRYTKGYYVAHTGKQTVTKKETAVAKSTPNNKTVSTSASPATEILNVTPAYKISSEIYSEKRNENAQANFVNKKSVNPVVTVQVESTKTSANTSLSVKQRPLQPLNNLGANKSDGGANLLVLVILCFLWFLNLIAVYVKDGHAITLNFWITLLLDFTFIGGVIFSLLVVLDIVDLG